MSIRFRLYLYIVFSLFWFFCGCGNEDLPSESNYAPKISLLKAETDIAEPGQKVSIYLKTIDLEGDPITCSWQVNGGIIQGDENGAIWFADGIGHLIYPDVDGPCPDHQTSRQP